MQMLNIRKIISGKGMYTKICLRECQQISIKTAGSIENHDYLMPNRKEKNNRSTISIKTAGSIENHDYFMPNRKEKITALQLT